MRKSETRIPISIERKVFFYCAIDRMSGGLSQSCSVTMRLLLASGFLALVLLGQCKGISDHDTAMQKWCVRKKTILMDTTKYIFIHSVSTAWAKARCDPCEGASTFSTAMSRGGLRAQEMKMLTKVLCIHGSNSIAKFSPCLSFPRQPESDRLRGWISLELCSPGW